MYYLNFIKYLLLFGGYALGGFWNYSLIVFIFGIAPLLDHLFPRVNPNKYTNILVSNLVLYITAFAHFPLLYLVCILSKNLNWIELLGFTFSSSLCIGTMSVAVAHELCHNSNRLVRGLAYVVLSTVGYPHFTYSHVKVHHKYLGTKKDPSTARLGQNIYNFIWKSYFDNVIYTWKYGKKQKLRLILGYLAEISFFIYLLTISYISALFYFVIMVLVIVSFEMINYMGHYGLKKKGFHSDIPYSSHNGYISEDQSWDYYGCWTNIFIWNLQTHANHHTQQTKPYYTLKGFKKTPKLPMSYPWLLLMTLFPPLWYKVMDKKAIKTY